MADIAVVFHWPPQAMEAMAIAELMNWHERAAKRSQSSDTPGKTGKR